MKKKKTWLRGLKISKVDVVPAGCNPDADIVITKGAESFSENIKDIAVDKIRSQIWDFDNALTRSLVSILNDDDVADKKALMKKSINEFYGAIGFAIEDWASGKLTEYRVTADESPETAEIMKGLAAAYLENFNDEDEKEKNDKNTKIQKGGKDDMKIDDIDTSLLTAEENQQLEAIVAKAKKSCSGGEEKKPSGGEPETKPDNNSAGGKEPPTPQKDDEEKKDVKKGLSNSDEGGADKSDDIYKGVHPLVAKELKEMRAFMSAAEDRELAEVAKGYEIIGKKPDELVPVLKQLKAAGGTAYNDMISVLDQAREAVEKSGSFDEIGRSGYGESPIAKSKAESRIEAKADEIRKAHPELTKEMAVVKAIEANPELYDEYQKEAY